MTARALLPLLGGAPAVWNSCMLFYQSALLGGYAYAHWSSTRLMSRQAIWGHFVVLLLPLAALPLALRAGEPPQEGDPVWWVMVALATSVGLPFFAVSTTAPLLQRWFARTGHPAGGDPYFLYAASNAGSLIGLIGYLVIIEPRFTLSEQMNLWSWGYGGFVVLVAACGAAAMGHGRWAVGNGTGPVRTHHPSPITAWRVVRWLLLAFTPASLMLGVTAYMSTDLAAVPLLWVLPLCLYLLSFMVAFSRRPWPPITVYQRLLPLLVLTATVLLARSTFQLVGSLSLHLVMFFCAAVACHGALAADRPPPEKLTSFYLALSIGGALGGLFNAILAPLVFRSVVEYPLALVLACGLGMNRAQKWRRGRGETSSRKEEAPNPEHAAPPGDDAPLTTRSSQVFRDVQYPLALLALTYGGMYLFAARGELQNRPATTAFLAALAVLCFLSVERPWRFALCIGAVLLALGQFPMTRGQVRYRERNFFGVVRVIDKPNGRDRELHHGTTMHGLQDAERLSEPLSYYSREGPIGQVISWARKAEGRGEMTVAVIGLGTGSIAAYAGKSDRFTFYEIDPAVARIAENRRWFTFIDDARARGAEIRVDLGDARLRIQDAPDGIYDLIVVDAFGSDSVPVHLLTREALGIYLRKLAPRGIIAFHISSRYLELRPVIAALARDSGVAALERMDTVDNDLPANHGRSASQWMVISRTPDDFGPLRQDERWRAGPFPPIRAWTDDYANILSVIDW